MLRSVWIALALSIATLGVYAQTANFDFIEFDDDRYVSSNEELLGPFDSSAVAWAFEPVIRISNWQPVTLLSYRFDSARHGIDDAGPYHVTNVVWHLIATLLLFGALRSLTGREIESGLVAAVFALHPLHVESVAWISSRKDVLVGASWWAATWAYVGYVRAESPARRVSAYVVALLAFAFALLAKPLAVTLPFSLLLFDVWPLNRLDGSAPGRIRRAALRLVLEKLPFFALTIAASIATLVVQGRSGAMESGKALTLLERTANAIDACATYVVTTLWPTGLAIFYPHPTAPGQDGLVVSEIAAATLLLAVLSVAAVLAARRGYFAFGIGWLFFLGTLVPMLGFIQVGFAAHADRYTYVSQTGLVVALVYGGGDWLRRSRPRWLSGATALAVAVCGLWGVSAHRQAALWRDTPTLFEHALVVTQRNDLIQYNYGTWLKTQGKPGAAKERFAQALAWNPDKIDAAVNLGLLLHTEGDTERGLALLRGVAARQPLHVQANLNLGVALAQAEDWAAARKHFEVVVSAGDGAEAAERFQALVSMATIDRLGGEFATAAGFYERALALRPDDLGVLSGLIDLYSRTSPGSVPSSPQAGRAVDLARTAVELSDASAASLGQLAQAYLAWGDRASARTALGQAIERARADDPGRLASLEELLDALAPVQQR